MCLPRLKVDFAQIKKFTLHCYKVAQGADSIRINNHATSLIMTGSNPSQIGGGRGKGDAFANVGAQEEREREESGMI